MKNKNNNTESDKFNKYELGYIIEALRYRERTVMLENELFASLDFMEYEIEIVNQIKKKCQRIALNLIED